MSLRGYAWAARGAPSATDSRVAWSLAAWLIQHETAEGGGPDAFLVAAEQTCQKLCGRLATMVTAAGCQLLLARAIHLAAAEAPFLKEMRAGTIPGVCLDGLQGCVREATAEQTQTALLAVVAHLIGLLALFIGDHMTGLVVREVWPEAPLSPNGTDSAPQETLS